MGCALGWAQGTMYYVGAHTLVGRGSFGNIYLLIVYIGNIRHAVNILNFVGGSNDAPFAVSTAAA